MSHIHLFELIYFFKHKLIVKLRQNRRWFAIRMYTSNISNSEILRLYYVGQIVYSGAMSIAPSTVYYDQGIYGYIYIYILLNY